MDDICLDHFIDAQNVDLEQVVAELAAGKKTKSLDMVYFPTNCSAWLQ